MSAADSQDRTAERVITMLKGVAAGMEDVRRWHFYGELLAAVGEIRLTIGADVESAAALDQMRRTAALPARLSDFDVEHVGEIVGDVRTGEYTNFSAHVCRLVKQKADREQREVLRLVYPDHVRAVELWETAAPGARIWRCPAPGCGTLNAVHPDVEAHPSTCLGCLGKTEPPRVDPRSDTKRHE